MKAKLAKSSPNRQVFIRARLLDLYFRREQVETLIQCLGRYQKMTGQLRARRVRAA